MSHLARLSLANRTIVALIALIIIGFGVFAIPQLKQELIPSIEFPAVSVSAQYPGAGPQIVEDQVTTPIEDATQGLDGLETVTSTSSEGSSNITLQFAYGTNVDNAVEDIQQSINRIDGQLPEDVDPQVISGSSDDIPVLVLAATSSLDQHKLANRLNDDVVPELNEIPGVRDTQASGDRQQEVDIALNEKKLRRKGLDATAVSQALTSNGTPIPTGSITKDTKDLTVQVGKNISSLDDIENLYLTPTTAGSAGASARGQSPAGAGQSPARTGQTPADAVQPGAGGQAAAPEPVKLGDVADVSLTDADATSLTRTNGKPSLGLVVTAASDGNNVAISEKVHDKLSGLADDVGHGTKLTVVFDQAPFVQDSIRSLGTEGLLGLGFAVLVILVFLLSVRSTIVTAVSIPLSLLIALIALWTGDLSLNLLTLGGLTVAIGRVVDDSIVVLENIKRHLGYGEDKRRAVLDGVREVATAVTASTLTTVAVFLPIGFVGGLVGELFRPFALSVTVALLASLIVALTIIPVLSYWFLKPPKVGTDPEAYRQHALEKERRNPLQRAYVPLIRFTTKHRLTTIGLALLIFCGTVAMGAQLKTNFLSDSGQNTMTINQTMPVGTNLQTTSDAARKVEHVLADEDEVDSYQVTIGGGLYGQPTAAGASQATFSITLDEDSDVAKVRDDIRNQLDQLDGAGDLALGVPSGGAASSRQIEVQVESTDQAHLRSGARQVEHAMAGMSKLTDVTSDLSDRSPRIQVSTKRSDAAKYGLSDSAIGQAVQQAMQGSTVTQMTVNGEQRDIVLKTDDRPKSLSDIRDLKLTTPAGQVPLHKVASVEQTNGPVTVSHIDGSRSATVSATPSGKNTGAITASLRQELDDLDLPNGVSYSLGGVSQDQSEAFRSLGLALAAAILIVFLIMTATFRSLAQPLILMVSVPFAATGAVGLLLVTDTALGVASLIGLLMLVGIVVTNAIVLLDLINRYRLVEGMEIREAVIEGSRRRLRPVLMTAIATIFALLPAALGVTGEGGFISQPLAVVVIGGLVSSTFLTLLLVPALYTMLESRKERRRQRKQARRARKEAKRAQRAGAGDRAVPEQPVGVAAAPAADGSTNGANHAAPTHWQHDRVGAALAGQNPTVLARMDAGFAVIGDTQFLPGYSVLLTDDPEASRLSDLPRERRLAFLADMERLGEAVERVCARRDPAFRRVNIEIQGNQDGFLHAHVWPRYDWEPAGNLECPVGRYDETRWNDPASRLGAQHDELRAELTAELAADRDAVGS
ncbi:MAG: efflux RND transporter permease subunit [Streptosporangiales bacterium]